MNSSIGSWNNNSGLVWNNNNSNVQNSNNNTHDIDEEALEQDILNTLPSSLDLLDQLISIDNLKIEKNTIFASSLKGQWLEMIERCSLEDRNKIPHLIFSGNLTDEEVNSAIEKIKKDFRLLKPDSLKDQEEMGYKLNFLHALHIGMKIWNKNYGETARESKCHEEYSKFFASKKTNHTPIPSKENYIISNLEDCQHRLKKLFNSIDDEKINIKQLTKNFKEQLPEIQKDIAKNLERLLAIDPFNVGKGGLEYCAEENDFYNHEGILNVDYLKGFQQKHFLGHLDYAIRSIKAKPIIDVIKYPSIGQEAFEEHIKDYDKETLDSALDSLREDLCRVDQFEKTTMVEAKPAYSIVQALCARADNNGFEKLKIAIDYGADLHWIPKGGFPLFPILMLYNIYLYAEQTWHSDHQANVKKMILLLEENGIKFDPTDPSVEVSLSLLPEMERLFSKGFFSVSTSKVMETFFLFLQSKGITDCNDAIFTTLDHKLEQIIEIEKQKNLRLDSFHVHDVFSDLEKFLALYLTSGFLSIDKEFFIHIKYLIFSQFTESEKIKKCILFLENVVSTINNNSSSTATRKSKKTKEIQEIIEYLNLLVKIRNTVLLKHVENDIEKSPVRTELQRHLPMNLVQEIETFSSPSRMEVFLKCLHIFEESTQKL